MNKFSVMKCALEAGIALSTAHGQQTNKLCPVSDAATLQVFADNILKVSATSDMLAMLERLEWVETPVFEEQWCPLCEGLKKNGHCDGCKLGNLLKRTRKGE